MPNEKVTPEKVAPVTVDVEQSTPPPTTAKEPEQKKIKAPLTAALKAKLLEEKEKLEKELAPHREFYEGHVNDKKYLEAKKKIKEISNKLGPINNELAALARAEGAKGIRAESGVFENKE